MILTLFWALLSITITISLGIFAAWHADFDQHDSQKLTQLVLKYALPLSVFSGILSTPRQVIIADLPFSLWILLGMVGTYLAYWLVLNWRGHTEQRVAILRSMAVSSPSVPFIGSAILPLLFSKSIAAIDIGISSLLMNVILVPLVLWQVAKTNKEADQHHHISTTLKNPLVFSALLAFALALCGIKLPASLAPAFTTLGQGAGGLAMFATGITLYGSNLKLPRQVVSNVTLKNLIIPLLIWGLMIVCQMPAGLIKVAVVTLAIPSAAIPTILAIKYQANAAEIAATQFYSTVSALVTLSIFRLYNFKY